MNDRIERVAQQMAQAAELIAAQEYEQAKALLETIDDPAARSVLERLNKTLAAERKAKQERAELEFYRNTMADRLSISNGQTLSIVCPNCKQAFYHPVDLQRTAHAIGCSNCQETFSTSIYKIRASRSQTPGGIGRDYSVRVIEPSGVEQLLSFNTVGVDKIELRSGDLAGFTYFQGRLIVVQNFTINQYWRIAWVQGKTSPALMILLKSLILVVLLIYFLIIQTR